MWYHNDGCGEVYVPYTKVDAVPQDSVRTDGMHTKSTVVYLLQLVGMSDIVFTASQCDVEGSRQSFILAEASPLTAGTSGN